MAPLRVDVLVDQGRKARLILFVHRIPFLPELLQDCLDVNCVPEHDHIDDQPERTELIFLSFVVALPQFAPFAAENDARDAVPTFSPIELCQRVSRASLLGADPGPEILGKSTAQQFRAFIEDMHQVLRRTLNLLADCRRVVPVSFSRHDILHIIALLIRNAAPSSDLRVRRKREARSITLWTAVFQVIPARFGGVTLEDLSSRWPKSLRRRFASAMLHRTRKGWPYSPWPRSRFWYQI
jgi:hypothetical protein